MENKNELKPGTKNAFFNEAEEEKLIEYYQKGNINQFHGLIL